MLAPFVDRACVLRHGRRGDRYRRAHRAAAGAALDRATAARYGLPRSAWGTALAHFGLGLTLLGIVGETQWGIERIAELKPGQTITIRRYELHFDGMAHAAGAELSRAGRRTSRCARRGEVVGVMEPSKRTFPSRGTHDAPKRR